MSTLILIVDDSADDRMLIRRSIQSIDTSIEIKEVETAQDGLQLISEGLVPDYLLLDYLLPDMDGINFLKEIYDESLDLGPFPVIMMTGQGSEKTASEAIRFGAQDYLIKGIISPDTLHIAMVKARQVYDLKQAHNDAKTVIEHSQKMDAVGKLTGGIAHDFNNLLTIIFGNTRLLRLSIEKENIEREACLKKIDVIERTASRGADLVKHLMVFSRQRSLDPKVTDISSLMMDLKEMMSRTLGNFINVEIELDDDLNTINVDPGQLENAIINMGVNARDVMLDGGTLKISARNYTIDAKKANTLQIQPGEYVRLDVSDTGVGMPQEVVEHIFEPFFTTKDVGQGTGLGLSIVYGFVKESSGGIDVQSAVGQGTTFSLYFPLTQSAAINPEHEEVSEEVKPFVSNNETILVVEDEIEIRFLTSAILRESGYEVIEAKDGDEALEFIKINGNKIDLVFTDISMPGDMNGVQMAARAQVINPDIKLLFTTGYSGGTVPDLELAERHAMLNKPYTPEQMISKICEILE